MSAEDLWLTMFYARTVLQDAPGAPGEAKARVLLHRTLRCSGCPPDLQHEVVEKLLDRCRGPLLPLPPCGDVAPLRQDHAWGNRWIEGDRPLEDGTIVEGRVCPICSAVERRTVRVLARDVDTAT